MEFQPYRNYTWESVACFHQQNILLCWNHGTEMNIWAVNRLWKFSVVYVPTIANNIIHNTYLPRISLFRCSNFSKFFEDVIAHNIHPEKCMKKWKLSNETQPFTNFLIITNPFSIIEIRSDENVKKCEVFMNIYIYVLLSWDRWSRNSVIKQ